MAFLSDSESWREWLEVVFSSIFFAFSAGIVPFVALFVIRGAESADFDKFMVYGVFMGLFFTPLILMRITEIFTKKNSRLYDKWGWIQAIFHDPDKGLVSILAPKFKKYFNASNIIFWSILIFSIIGLWSVFQNSFFVTLPKVYVEQQVTETGQLLLAGEPASSQETILFTYIASVILGLIIWASKTKRINEVSGWILRVGIFPALFVGLVVMFHFARYGATDTALVGTAIFGMVGALSFLIFGSFIPWYIFHVSNNFLQQANKLFPDELTAVGVITFLLIVIIVRIIVFFNNKSSGSSLLGDFSL